MAAEEHSPIYDDLMRFRPEGLTPNAWAVLAGVSRTVWADMRRHGNPSRRTLEKLLSAAGSSLAEFEALRIGATTGSKIVASAAVSDRGSASWGPAQLPPLPVVGTAPGGDWRNGVSLTEIRTAEIVDRAARPATLATDAQAYAIAIVGESMWPRFRRGRRVAVSPNAAIALGDDVLVKLRNSGEEKGPNVLGFIKELVQNSSSGVKLRQFNPDMTFNVPAGEVVAIEKVIGELI